MVCEIFEEGISPCAKPRRQLLEKLIIFLYIHIYFLYSIIILINDRANSNILCLKVMFEHKGDPAKGETRNMIYHEKYTP